MKILMPYISRFGDDSSIFNKESVAGGIELFGRLVYENLDNVIPLEISPQDQKDRKVTKMIVDAVIRHKPDIILTNYNYATTTINIWKYIRIPILWINHITPGAITTMEHMRIISEFLPRQPILGFVSKYQFSGYQERLEKKYPEVKIDNLRFFNSCFCYDKGIEPNNEKPIYDVCTIGRMNRVKDPFWLLKKMKKTDKVCTVFTSKNIYDPKDKQYFEDNAEFHDVLQCDLPHAQVMEELSKSRAYMSTCAFESWGITALEALEQGVPLLIRASKGKHASMDISPSPDYYRLIDNKTTDEQIDQYLKEFDAIDKNDIIIDTLNKHSKEKWVSNLIESLETTIKTYTK
tara:strand:+ start:71 stop:1114 length:1044 start_codon:yes stop_codon:yes gene_type:complete